MFALASPSSVLRFLMLALLMASVLVKPVLAVECEVRDAQRLVSGHMQAAVSEAAVPGDDCCAALDCSDCCAHTVALQPPTSGGSAVPVTAPALTALSVDFEPIAFPVAFRPPIAT